MITQALSPTEPDNKQSAQSSRHNLLTQPSWEQPVTVTSHRAGHSPKGFIARSIDLLYKSCIEPLVASKNPPGFDALGVSFGLAVGFLIPVGGHFLFLALLRILFRFSYVVAAAFTFVSNPLNMIPLYYGYYCLGSVLLGKSIAVNLQVFEKLMNPVIDKTYFWEALAAFIQLGCEILARWVVAAAVFAGVFGIAGYIVTYKIQQNRCRKAAKKMGMRYEEFVQQLRNASCNETS
ncbi:MAG: DUF2062 domain-containing protein [Deltaproteobacteria bacterium]|jgi:uncharacterized protein (DUF2062 family)|nr:DUF2062 domain-containing protein [Deltaproteobacteria bacterium]